MSLVCILRLTFLTFLVFLPQIALFFSKWWHNDRCDSFLFDCRKKNLDSR